MVEKAKGSETKPVLLKLDESSKTVSATCKLKEKAVKKVLRATMTALGQAIEQDARIRVQGLGTFTRTAAKEEGKFRTRFRPQAKGAGKGAGKGVAAEDDE
jgi:hypothetical protein